MTHPHRLRLGQIRMQFTANDFQFGSAVLTGAGARDGTAERLRHRLKSVADTEHRHAQVEQRRIQLWRALGVHTGGATGEHYRLRVTGFDLVDRRGVRNHFGVHPGLAHPAGDQLGILCAEVDHQHWSGRRSGHIEVSKFRHTASLVARVDTLVSQQAPSNSWCGSAGCRRPRRSRGVAETRPTWRAGGGRTAPSTIA